MNKTNKIGTAFGSVSFALCLLALLLAATGRMTSEVEDLLRVATALLLALTCLGFAIAVLGSPASTED